MAEIVVITEGTSGVGRAFARRLARSGAKIAVLGSGMEALRETAIDLVTQGASAALAIPCDINDSDMVARATRRIEEELGPIDVWIDAEAGPERRRATVRQRALLAGAIAAAAGILTFAIVKLARR